MRKLAFSSSGPVRRGGEVPSLGNVGLIDNIAHVDNAIVAVLTIKKFCRIFQKTIVLKLYI